MWCLIISMVHKVILNCLSLCIRYIPKYIYSLPTLLFFVFMFFAGNYGLIRNFAWPLAAWLMKFQCRSHFMGYNYSVVFYMVIVSYNLYILSSANKGSVWGVLLLCLQLGSVCDFHIISRLLSWASRGGEGMNSTFHVLNMGVSHSC